MSEKIYRCIKCNDEFTEDEAKVHFEDRLAKGHFNMTCPSCGTTSLPSHIADDVEVKMNWHELRILTIWAENYARGIDDRKDPNMESLLLTVMSIAARIQKQYPDKVPLTLFSEIRSLREDYNVISDLDDDERLMK